MGSQAWTFRLEGGYNAGMVPVDLQTGAAWSPIDGVALEGPHRGTALPPIATYQTTWLEWRTLHPDTEVAVWTHPTHRDGRHGHASNQQPGSRGIEPHFLNSIGHGELDTHLRENVWVLGVNLPDGARAYPLDEVRRHGCVVADRIGPTAIVVLNDPHSQLCGAYLPTVGGRPLTFAGEAGRLHDWETGSIWSAEGRCLSGPLAGSALEPVRFVLLEWHSWSCYHPDSAIYTSPEGEASEAFALEPDFARLFDGLSAAGFHCDRRDRTFDAWLPNAAERGYGARVNGDDLLFVRFSNATDAEDFCYATPHAIRVGRYALRSDPPVKFADAAQMRPLPDARIAWSPLLDDDGFLATATAALEKPLAGLAPVGLATILQALAKSGWPSARPAVSTQPMMMYEHSLPVDAVKGYMFRFTGVQQAAPTEPKAGQASWMVSLKEQFSMFEMTSAAAAATFGASQHRALTAGRFVLKSDPEQYVGAGSINRPDDQVEWSTLPLDPRFAEAFQRAALGR